MGFFWEGIKIGVVLTLMIGPLFFTLVQTGIEEGFKAGAIVGAGIWVSDFLFILLVYGGTSVIAQHLHGLNIFMGVGGSALLASFGLGQLLTSPKGSFLQDAGGRILSGRRSSSGLSLWMKGFLINTVNPFTLFFWLGLIGAVAVREVWSPRDAVAFFGGILSVIVVGDLAKVLLAKKIRRIMQPVHLLWLRRISGAALIAFGAVLFVRSLF
jgi:threonine/homoserine/homoserine lactone efflux protein